MIDLVFKQKLSAKQIKAVFEGKIRKIYYLNSEFVTCILTTTVIETFEWGWRIARHLP